jgi:hypothetical protein
MPDQQGSNDHHVDLALRWHEERDQQRSDAVEGGKRRDDGALARVHRARSARAGLTYQLFGQQHY